MAHSLLKILIISILFFSGGCDKIKYEPSEKLKPHKSFSLKITEPSGIALAQGKLWIVSDRKGNVYQTDLKGNIEFSFGIDGNDLEGISVINDSLLGIVNEIPREVTISDFFGNAIFRYSIELGCSKYSGLEGITYNPSNERFYLVNEKDPVLLIETDKNLKEISRKKVKNVKDLSGISYSKKEDCLWLLSDEDRKIIKSTLEGEFIKEYRINIEQPEGIAVDDENNLIYVVSDKEEKLYVFEIE